MRNEASLYIGLMSGTSMDGIDAVLVDINENHSNLKNHLHLPYSPDLLDTLRQLSVPGNDEIDLMGRADIEVADALADACLQLLNASGCSSDQICAIGSHGQTIRHRPNLQGAHHESSGFTLQIGDPNTLAAKTGISVVADFRRKDMAIGGQGAPLAPGFHLSALNDSTLNQVILNLGGIANITYLPVEATADNNAIIGFDTGPANALIDAWYQQNFSGSFDNNGAWAGSGKVNTLLLKQLLNDPYFDALPPKSTGREYFSIQWVNKALQGFVGLSAADVQATLAELTITSICEQIHKLGKVDCVHVCGGGVFNRYLMDGFNRLLDGISVSSTESKGVDPMHIEAMAFAWLAYRRIHNLSGNLPSVTGAKSSAVLGSIHLPN